MQTNKVAAVGSYVLHDWMPEDCWSGLLSDAGETFQEPDKILFSIGPIDFTVKNTAPLQDATQMSFINDSIIDYYTNRLKKQYGQYQFFNAQLWLYYSKHKNLEPKSHFTLDTATKDIHFIPINYPHNVHWTLVAIDSRMKRLHFYFYDSLSPTSVPNEIKSLISNIFAPNEESPIWHLAYSPRQHHLNCALFTLANIETICKTGKLEFSQNDFQETNARPYIWGWRESLSQNRRNVWWIVSYSNKCTFLIAFDI